MDFDSDGDTDLVVGNASGVLLYFEKHGGGSLINISSVHGLLAAPKAMIYESVK